MCIIIKIFPRMYFDLITLYGKNCNKLAECLKGPHRTTPNTVNKIIRMRLKTICYLLIYCNSKCMIMSYRVYSLKQ